MPLPRPVASSPFAHPLVSRRCALQAGAIGLLGLGSNHLEALRAADSAKGVPAKARSVIYIFLSGGLAQQDSFDLKPEAPRGIRGDFNPIDTKTPGIQICEHLPMLAERSNQWALCRSLTHPHNNHSEGHTVMLTGRSEMPVGYNGSLPQPIDWPAILAIGGALTQPRNNLPPAVVLPEKIVHNTGRTLPGQFGGMMGQRRDPWFLESSRFEPKSYGAYPDYNFDHVTGPVKRKQDVFEAPSLNLPPEFGPGRLNNRLDLLKGIDQQRADLERYAQVEQFDRFRQRAVSLLTDARVKRSFDVSDVDPKILDRYGRNSFGWSLLMSRRLVEAGVNLVQVNLGNNESWDTHGNAFPNLKNYLFPPTDRAVSALLDDLQDHGLLDSTLVVMAGEFGRTPHVSGGSHAYKSPGRDHWGGVQTVWFAGGGVRGGTVIGSSDKYAGYPATEAQKPENMAATIYQSLGLPDTAAWHDELDRPHHIYSGDPIPGLI